MKIGVHPTSGPGHKLSFKNVSNVVVQLLHSIKYSVEVPFSNINSVSDAKGVGGKVRHTSFFSSFFFFFF